MSDLPSELDELRHALEDAIRRGYCEPIIPRADGEPDQLVRDMRRANVISDPNFMRHLAGIQAAAWEAVQERVEGGPDA